MAGTLQEVLVRALKKLGESSFQRFIEKLRDWEVREKYTKIPKDKLMRKDPEHIAGLINRYYRDGYGAEVTLDILEGINEKKAREELQQDLMEVDFRRRGLGTPMFTERLNFIGHHRSDLIRWIKDVDPVLRDLRDQELVTQEQYIYVMEMKRSQKKIKELCDIIRYWADSGKCTAYTVLRKYNEKLIKDLEMKDRMRRNAHSRRFKERINFIDDHRSDLIRWITDVDPFLRDLRDQELLTQEEYDDVMKKPTKKKIRKLCDVISHWEDTEKYKAYITLREFNKQLIIGLERNDSIWRNAHSQRFSDMINFIEHYRSDLIRRIRNVKTILCDLRDQELLTQEQHNDVMEKPTNRKKMEELCDVISQWKPFGKYKAYITLRKYNPKIITDWEVEDLIYRNSQSGCFWDHFVNRHRSHLTNNIKEVDPVVDDLRSNHFLNEKEYRGLQAMTTQEDKMEYLFYIFWHKCDTVKDQFYISFWRYNYTVINRLEKSEKLGKLSEAEDRVLDTNILHLKKRKQVIYPIIDDLFFESLLTGEECDYIMEMSDMEYSERGLYTIIRDWDEDDKQKVYHSITDNLQVWKESSELQKAAGDHVISDECSKTVQTNKQRDHEMGMPRSKDKMRRLYCIISGFNDDDKKEVVNSFYKPSRTYDLKMKEDEAKLEEDASSWNQLV